MRIFFLFLFFLSAQLSFSKGIVIGNDSLILHVFQKFNQTEIDEFSYEISEKYSKVILHLGSKYSFSGGSFFGTEKSQRNLKRFAHLMDSSDVKLYFWFLDSYGNKMFKQIHEDHLEIIGDLRYHLKRLKIPFDGFVLDMEWINRPFGHNNDEYIEILKNVKSHFPSKQLFVFASIIDDPNHNIERGFDERRIITVVDNIIPMLYPVDGGFYLDYSLIKLRLHDRRLSDLRAYYELRNYFVTVSVEQGMLKKYWRKVTMINHLSLNDTTFNNLKKVKEYKSKYYSIYKYKANKDCYLPNERGANIFLKRKGKIYYLKISDALIKEHDFIWEYLYVRNFGF